MVYKESTPLPPLRWGAYVVFFLLFISLLSAEASEELYYARQLMGVKQYDEAFLQVNHLITEYPNSLESLEARIMLAEILLERKLYQEARIQLLLLLRNPFLLTYDQRAKTYNILASASYQEKNYEQALESYEKLFLDYKDSPHAISAIPNYFESYFALGDYQSVIVKSRDLFKHYKNEEVMSELLFYEAKGYFTGNMTDQANRTIQEIRSKYSHTMAAWRAIELQVLLRERQQGKLAASEMLETVLTQRISRLIEEKLSWILVQYYLDLNKPLQAKEKLDFIVNKFNLSADLSTYLNLWMKLLLEDKDINPILSNEEYIIVVSKNKPEYYENIYYLAMTRFLAKDYWAARNFLDESMTHITDEALMYNYLFLYADIYAAQGQFINSIEIYNRLLNQFSHLGRNYDVLMKLGDIYATQFQQPGQALNFYRQATTLALSIHQTSSALQKSAECLEVMGQYTEALNTLLLIPLDKITNTRTREYLSNKITLLQIFYHSDSQNALASYFKMHFTDDDLGTVNYATLLAVELKKLDQALEILKNQDTYGAYIEKIKIYFLCAYKSVLENKYPEADRYISIIENEIDKLGDNLIAVDRSMIDSFRQFIINRAILLPQNLNSLLSYVNTDPVDENRINFRNFFKYQLWKYYHDNNMTSEAMTLAHNITQDAFVSDADFQRVNVLLACSYFQNQEYILAIEYFHKADRYLTIAHPEYFYQYAMSLYYTENTDKSFDILQRLVLNNIDNESLVNARNLVITYFIQRDRLIDALDVLDQIPLLQKNDTDYRNYAQIYNLQGNLTKEKEAMLYIQEKSFDELLILARLHLLTDDKVMADYTWRDIIKRSSDSFHKMNSYAGLGNMAFMEEKYTEAIKSLDEYFKIFNKNTPHENLSIPPATTAKELIISCYMTNNRVKAETTQKNLGYLLTGNDNLLADIKIHEGIYYTRREPKKAASPLTQVINNKKISPELTYKALLWRGTLYVSEKKFDDAEKDFIAALSTTDVKLKNQVRLKLGNLYFSLERFPEALEYYYQVIANDHDGTLAKDAAHNFAVTARFMQEWNMAIAAYKIIIDRWGQSHIEVETRLTIGFSFYMAKEYDEAINLLNQLMDDLKTNEQKAEALFWIAESYSNKRLYDEAEKTFLAIKTSHSSATQWVNLVDLKIASLYIAQDDIETAISMLNDVIRKQGANSDAGKEATRLLEQLTIDD